ncbi:D-arabinono-1,4-lactone oxidase [Solwaraspora sp. WMMD406]|uniref:D-arabinono-1,4-lactone oxidase n=1 Tax=Solwaraspora sp. WMMD406 TaxID=3016095 RepID=UPI002417E09B|nr:D-arabinono-1,4-lactone oxidase [Solwaraspora sp. WMMD406]MDG4763400.1 D-arabinono-1,4-lactone oxidase [Solwaraspora sp. WMMD406]
MRDDGMHGAAAPPDDDQRHWSNWAGNQQGISRRVLRPETVADLQAMIRTATDAGARVKAVGNGHSFSDISRADDHRVELSGLRTATTVDTDARLATIPAGMSLHQLNELLAGFRLALPNVGDVDVQTVAGAIATGTHGTGATHGNLASVVEALTLVTADGTILRCSARQHQDVFAAARIGLGALGVVTEVTLRCVDAFVLRARERAASLRDVVAALPELVGGNDHIEFYWFPYTDRVQLKTNNRVPVDDRPRPRWRRWLDDEFVENTLLEGVSRLGRTRPRLVPALSALSARVVGSRTYTARSDRVFCTPRRVRFIEMEYALPRAALPVALAALPGILDRLPSPVALPVEVRFAAGDDSWLSHAYQRDSAYLAVHQYVGMPYEPYFRAVEQVAVGLDGRPHWGKLHYRHAESLRSAYPRFDDFLAVRDRLDPCRTFANHYTERVLGP